MAVVGANTQSGAGAFIATTPGTVLLTVTAAHTFTISKLLITNTDTSSGVTASIFHIPSGGSFSGDDYVLIKALTISASDGNGGCEDVRECAGLILEAGDKLQVFAGTGSKLKFNVSYVDNG